MRRILTFIACFGLLNMIVADVGSPPFHVNYWFADGIVIGRVALVGEMTVELDVQTWIRDRTEKREPRILVFRYTKLSCTPRAPETYQVGSEYVLFMRKPYDEGAGGNEHWAIILQHRVLGIPLCLDNLNLEDVVNSNNSCVTSVTEALFVDALQSFESCFQIEDDRIRGSFPSKQVCSDAVLHAWSARSPMHEMLARTARERILEAKSK